LTTRKQQNNKTRKQWAHFLTFAEKCVITVVSLMKRMIARLTFWIMYYVYVLFSLKCNTFYYGFTENLRTRLSQHQNGLSIATKGKRPLELVYYEAYKNKKDALEREKFFKTGWGRKYIKKILKNYLSKEK